MGEPVFQRAYLILGQDEGGEAERLIRWVEQLLPRMALSANLYLVSPSLPGSLRQVGGLLERLAGYLKDQPLPRLNLLLFHPLPPAEGDKVRAAYRALGEMVRPFNREGFLHQEVPRLILMPIVKVARENDLAAVAGLLQQLRRLFFIPSLYLPPGLVPGAAVLSAAERTYWGREEAEDIGLALLRLADYAILDDSLVALENSARSLSAACAPSLVASASGGAVYACPRAYRLEEPLGNIYQGEPEGSVLASFGAQWEALERRGECLRCREEAAASFVGLPELRPEAEKMGALLYSFGNLHLEKGDYPAAVASLERAGGLVGPAEIDHLNFRLGLAHLNLGKHGLALEKLNRAAATYRSQYYFHFYTGLCRYQGGEGKRALEDFSRALELGPPAEDQVQILIYRGVCLNGQGEYAAAAASLEEAKKIAGPTKEICNALGFSYYKLADYDLAIENLREAVRLDPSSAIDYASLGTNLKAKGETAEAIRMYEKALELDPTLEFARRGLEELKGER